MKSKKLTVPFGSTASAEDSRRSEWIKLLIGSFAYLTRNQLAEECRKRKIPIAKHKWQMAFRLAQHVVDEKLPVTVTIG